MKNASLETRTVRFELRPEDLAAFSYYQLLHSPAFLRQRRLGMVIPPLLLLIGWTTYVMFSDTPEETAGKLWWLLLYAPVHYLLQQWRWQRNYSTLLERLLHESKKSSLLGKRRMVLTPERVSEHNPFSEISASWAQVQKLERQQAHTFLFLSPSAALIIPKHAFENEKDYDEYVNFAQQHLAAARAAAKAILAS